MAKGYKKLTEQRTRLIDSILAGLEALIKGAQGSLFEDLISEVFDRLDTKSGRIENTAKNKRSMSAIDKAFDSFNKDQGQTILKELVKSVDEVIKFNIEYFNEIDDAPLKEFDGTIRKSISEWLGIKDGKIAPNGYLDKLVTDTTVRNQVKDLTFKNVVTRNGMSGTRNELEKLIKGNKDSLGALEKNLGGFVYDTISVTDRIIGLEYANEKGYEFAIYEGGLIGTSRQFCRDRNGKVFHRDEIAKFNPTKAKPPNYNPFTDLGGYRCRHHLNWISTALAIRLRPDAISFVNAA